MRAGDNPNAKLSDAQHTLAQRYGFESWPTLVAHVNRINPPGLSHYETLAASIADAYTAPDMNKIRQINWNYGSSFVWDRDPTKMQKRLPNWYASAERTPALALDDARRLVARGLGFDHWNDLKSSLGENANIAYMKKGGDALPPYLTYDADEGRIHIRGPISDRHWETAVAIMKERGVRRLHAGGMTDAALRRLTKVTTIISLDTESGGLTDDGMLELASMPQLRHLNCGGPASIITDRGMHVLSHLPNLERFQMSWAPRITDHGAVQLRHCEKLQIVNLMGTRTGDGAIRALAGKQCLTHLSTGALVSDAGLPHLHELPRFKTWQGEETDIALMDYEAKPNHLMLDGPFTDSGFRATAGLNGLYGLNFFWHVTALTSNALASLEDMPRLGFLSVEGNLCDDRAMQHIAKIPRLRMLLAQGAVAGDVGFTALSASPSIENIWARESHNLGSAGFVALARMQSLKKVALSLGNVSDDALAVLPEFRALREITPMDVDDSAFRHIGRCADLEKLYCMYCRDTGDAATQQIAGLKHLKHYYAGATQITDRSCSVLAGIDSLETIEFWDIAAITNEGVVALADLPRLRELSISNSPLVTRMALDAFPAHVRTSWT